MPRWKQQSWRHPRSKQRKPWAERPSQTMEKHLAAVCACLDGDLYLRPREDPDEAPTYSRDDPVPPVPWIVVHFRAKAADMPLIRVPNVENVHPNITSPNQDTYTKVDNSIVNVNVQGNVSTTLPHDRSDRKPKGASNDLQHTRNKLVAIRFLSLVARCPEYSWRGNPQFWRHVLTKLCGAPDREDFFAHKRTYHGKQASCAPARNLGEVVVMPAFKLIFVDVKVTSKLMELCEQAFSSSPENEIFAAVNQRVENMLSVFGVRIPLQTRVVEISICFQKSQLVENASMRGIQAVLTSASNNKGSISRAASVCFASRYLNLTELSLSKRDLVLLAQTITLSSLALRELKLNGVFTAKSPQCCVSAFSSVVAACFATQPLGSVGVDDFPATCLTRLNLDSCALNVFQLASLFSAIHAGNDRQLGVRELSLQRFCGIASWLWLGFGLFHRTSRSQITHLDLSNCVLRLEDIELVRSLLDSADYAPHLTRKSSIRTSRRPPRALDHESSHQWVLLRAGARLEVPRDRDQRRGFKSYEVLELETEKWCEALLKGEKWACVLVPAYGRLWVNASMITETKSCSQHNFEKGLLQQEACKLEALSMISVKTSSQVLQVTDEDHLSGSDGAQPVDRVLSEWVVTVGQSLRTLQLRYNPLATNTLAVVLESCPLLQHLDVEGCELTSLSPITDAFRRENCRLQSLKAAQNDISTTSQVNLFHVLGDPDCDAGRHLRVLHLDENPKSQGNRILTLVVATLGRNKTLRELKMTMDTKHENALTLRHTFDKHYHNEWLGCEGLSYKQRMALLSIPSMKTLPVAVVEIIFEFAKRDIYRQIHWE